MKNFLKEIYFTILYLFSIGFRKYKKIDKSVSGLLPVNYCFDIGASYYAHPKWDIFINSPQTNWVAIEPNKNNLDYVKRWKKNSKVYPIAKGLSKKGGKTILYKTNIDSGSSLLKPVLNPDMEHRITDSIKNYLFPYEEKIIETESLQSIFESVNYINETPSLIKLDTQGSELEIIKGIDTKYFNSIICIELENTFLVNPIMEGSSHFHETMEFMYENNFEILKINPISSSPKSKKIHYKPNYYLNEADCLFTKKFSFIKQASLEIQKAMLGVYLTYNFYDELNALANFLINNQNIKLSSEEYKRLLNIINLTS